MMMTVANRDQRQQIPRPPVVTVLGHIDHGKTTLLDAIRKSNVAAGETGAITQRIGAYQVPVLGRSITFVDTPGHAVFEAMRSRGAQVADLAILVVAADDGVKQQTVEAIKHIQSAQIPFIVAINKIDLPQANPARVREELAKHGVLLENFGGQVPWVEISAKNNIGIENLLELILLIADIEGLSANPSAPFRGVVIESFLDKSKGPVGTLIVKDGSLKVGDEIVADGVYGKVRALFDTNGRPVKEAGLSAPVEVLGFRKVPEVGVEVKSALEQPPPSLEPAKPAFVANPLDLIKQKETKKDKLPLLIKADSLGSVEAITGHLPDKVWVVSSGVGLVTEQDLLLAESTGAIIYTFGLKLPLVIEKQAQNRQISIRKFNLIYELLADIESELQKVSQKQLDAKIDGAAKILAEFNVDNQKVAGCLVVDGFLEVGRSVRLLRDDQEVGMGMIKSLKKRKEAVQQVPKGQECGVMFDPPLDFQVGDRLELLPVEENK